MLSSLPLPNCLLKNNILFFCASFYAPSEIVPTLLLRRKLNIGPDLLDKPTTRSDEDRLARPRPGRRVGSEDRIGGSDPREAGRPLEAYAPSQ